MTGHNSSVATVCAGSLQMVTWSHSNVIIRRESRGTKTLDTLAKDIQSIIQLGQLSVIPPGLVLEAGGTST